ncbi:unnamed protein product [Pleuronectes platessa]|uniref:Uncharacterized protein n=1 Tax=Pleuronectes platessa TaxID=8262 RepID=A0A9N7UMY8_PLEPL|nr:unnamed protein product [Pleuronectes platessa]
MKPALKFPAKIKHGDSISSGGRAQELARSLAELRDFLSKSTAASTTVHPCRRDEAEFRSKNKRRIRLFARILRFNETFTGLPEIRAPRASNTTEVTIADLFLAVTRRTETSHPVPLSTVFSRSARFTHLITDYLRICFQSTHHLQFKTSRSPAPQFHIISRSITDPLLLQCFSMSVSPSGFCLKLAYGAIVPPALTTLQLIGTST